MELKYPYVLTEQPLHFDKCERYESNVKGDCGGRVMVGSDGIIVCENCLNNQPRCDCGAPALPYSPFEDRHFVWSVRRDGTRSNLGVCPFRHGWQAAIWRCYTLLHGAEYRGEALIPSDPKPDFMVATPAAG